MINPLRFNYAVAKDKPTNKDSCPFCAVDKLEKIIDQKDSFIWLDNKFNTIEDTYQTLIIESNEHFGDTSNYTIDYNRKLFRYIVEKWFELSKDKRFKSVALFKNFGTLSGGSLRHPHFQIVGMKSLNAYENIRYENFIGEVVVSESNTTAEINISKYPIMGFTEFNIIVSDINKIDFLADGVRDVLIYILSDFIEGKCESYNLFFYFIDDKLICKVSPRFVVSAYYVGYGIPQTNSQERVEDIKKELLSSILKNN